MDLHIFDNIFDSFDSADHSNFDLHSHTSNGFEHSHMDSHADQFGHPDIYTHPDLFGGTDSFAHTGDISDHTDYLNMAGGDIQDFDSWYSDLHGTPVEDSLVWHHQTTDFTCGVVSSEMVMDMFGLDISEAQLVYEATSAGYLTDHGISFEGIQYILNNHGISTHFGSGGIENLTSELDMGHKIIVPVDSGEIWGTDSPFEDMLGENADHAVVVTGIDLSSHTVVLNDPGHPEGQAMTLDLDKFMDAWKDSGYQFIATDSSPL